MIALMEATNDVGLLTAQASYAANMGQAQSLSSSLAFFAHGASKHLSLGGMVRRIAQPSMRAAHQRRGAPANRAALPRGDYEKRLRAFVGVARAFDAVPVLMTQPLSTMRNELTPGWVDAENQDVFNDLIRKVGADEHALVIESRQAREDRRPPLGRADERLLRRHPRHRRRVEDLCRVRHRRAPPGRGGEGGRGAGAVTGLVVVRRLALALLLAGCSSREVAAERRFREIMETLPRLEAEQRAWPRSDSLACDERAAARVREVEQLCADLRDISVKLPARRGLRPASEACGELAQCAACGPTWAPHCARTRELLVEAGIAMSGPAHLP